MKLSTCSLPLLTSSFADYEDNLSALRSRLGGAAFEEAWAEGMAMTPEEAVEYALSEEEPMPSAALPPEEAPADKQSPALTHREQEVALLVARGLTNRQISTELGISERTAGNHVARTLRKLELRSRAQIAAWVTERRLPGDPNSVGCEAGLPSTRRGGRLCRRLF